MGILEKFFSLAAPPKHGFLGDAAVMDAGDAEKLMRNEFLEHQKNLFEAIFKGVPDAMMLADPERRIIMCNPAVKAIFGYEEKELLGRQTEVLYESREEFDRQGRLLYNLSAKEKSEPYTVNYRRKNGEIFPGETIGTPIHDGAGNVLGFLGVIRDITERKQTDEKLRKSAMLVELLQKTTAEANAATNFRDAISACLSIVNNFTGWSVGHAYVLSDDEEDLLVSSRIWDLDVPQRFATFVEVSEKITFLPGIGLPGRVLESGKPAWIFDITKDTNFPRLKHAEDLGVHGAFAFPVLCGDRVVAVLEFFSVRKETPDNALLSSLAQISIQLGRVCEREQAEISLRESEARLKSIIDTVPAIITVKDTESRYQLTNNYHKEFFGFDEKAIQGKTSAIYSPEHGERVKNFEQEVIKTGKVMPYYDY